MQRTPEKEPWWQTTRSTFMGFVLAVALLALGGFLVGLTGGNHEEQLLRLSAGALFLAIGIIHLVSAITMYRHRHDRSGPAADHRATTAS